MQSTLKQNDYRQVIHDVFEARVNSNPRYSLRSFARDLEIAPSQLSLILNKKKGLSAQAAAKMSNRLGLTPSEQERFCDLVSSQHARGIRLRQRASERLLNSGTVLSKRDVDEGDFCLISDWFYSAILEMCKIKKTIWNVPKLARRLNLSETQTDLAVSRLKKLGLLTLTSNGLRPKQDSMLSVDNVPSRAKREFHCQLMKKASLAIHEQPVDQRYFRTELLPVRKSDVLSAQKDIREFFESFVEKYSTAAEGSEVYSLGVQYFRVGEGES